MKIKDFKVHWLYLAGFFLILALPLLNLPPWFSPSDWGKTIVFRIILPILIFLFIWQILFQKSDNRFSTIWKNILDRKSKIFWIFWLLIVLLGIYFLATIFSLNPHFSLWGDPHRSGGFLNFSFYIIFAILAFLILRSKDWQKIWDFSLIVGIFVASIAIFQQFAFISEFFIPFWKRAPSTIGGPIFLAIYLLLLSFLALAFGLKEKNWGKKFFYFISLSLFLFVAVFITQTRAVIVGLIIGFLYFLLFYPVRKKWLSLGLKITALIVLISVIYGFYYINTQPELPQFVQENTFLKKVASRFSTELLLQDPRISAWKVSWEALKARPILGYGPENFSIGFDEFYDPALPHITKGSSTGWWDRAHNFIFDISVTAGIPALIIYLSLFGVLFWQLQRLKSAENYADNNAEKTPKVIYHGIQATFIGYLVANSFGFDAFSTYLILFLLIGYSLHLISLSTAFISGNQLSNQRKSIPISQILKWRGIILFVLFVGLVWFIWSFSLKPLQINSEINWAVKYYLPNKQCEKALVVMEKILPSHSVIDHYLRLQYIDVINECFDEKPEKKLELARKEIEILKENVKLRPYYTRNWWFLGASTNFLISSYKEQGVKKEVIKELKKEANSYLEKAHQLRPKGWKILEEWAKTDLLTGEYEKAKEKSQKCLNIEPNAGECWWRKALSNIYLGQKEEGQADIRMAIEKGYNVKTKKSLLQLAKAYIHIKDYQALVDIYQKLINLEPDNYEYHGSLAVCYKELGQFEKAREEALKVLELLPEARAEIEEFLKSLPN